MEMQTLILLKYKKLKSHELMCSVKFNWVYMLLINFVFRVCVIHCNFFCTYIAVTITATHRISLWDMRLENATHCRIDVTVSLSYISVGIGVYVYAVVRHFRFRHSTKHSCGPPIDLYSALSKPSLLPCLDCISGYMGDSLIQVLDLFLVLPTRLNLQLH